MGKNVMTAPNKFQISEISGVVDEFENNILQLLTTSTHSMV